MSLLTAWKFAETPTLEIAYFDVGASSNSLPVVLLHGFPYDPYSFDVAADHLVRSGQRCIIPYLRGYGPTRFLSKTTMRSGEQAAIASDLVDLMNALRLDRIVVGGFDWGSRAASIAATLWPERIAGLVSCGPAYNIQDIPNAGQPAAPEDEYRFWYQYYFHSERGRAGLSQNRESVCRLLWRLWSPTWCFDSATFNRSAASFHNPDFVEIVIHSYRHRFGLVGGDPRLESIEARLAEQPDISVPAVILQGLDDGVDPPNDADEGLRRITNLLTRRLLPGTGHNVPQEQPDTFARAVLDTLEFSERRSKEERIV